MAQLKALHYRLDLTKLIHPSARIPGSHWGHGGPLLPHTYNLAPQVLSTWPQQKASLHCRGPVIVVSFRKPQVAISAELALYGVGFASPLGENAVLIWVCFPHMELAKGAFYHIHTPYSSLSQALPTSRFLSLHLSELSLFLLAFCSLPLNHTQHRFMC